MLKPLSTNLSSIGMQDLSEALSVRWLIDTPDRLFPYLVINAPVILTIRERIIDQAPRLTTIGN